MIKLYKARSLLYRRQILQENIRWKALDEIYKIYIFAPLRPQYFRNNFVKPFRIFRQHFLKRVIFQHVASNFAQILMKFCRNFADILENVEHDS